MRCLRCGNRELKYFYKDNETWYCRKCIGFGRVNVYDVPKKISYTKKKHNCNYELKYPLTSPQKKAVEQIMYYINQRKDVLIFAATGAGKTELTMEAIKQYLNAGKKVCFSISRRQVVLEIQERMQKAFPSLKVIAVCEGFSDIVDGDLIVCTMHQLYRYYKTFDLLIMDEVDAFPYRDNELLEQVALASCVGEKIYLSATPSEDMLRDVKEGKIQLVELFERPHGYPLIVPVVKRTLKNLQYVFLIRFLFRQRKKKIQTLVFVPTIALAQQLAKYLKMFFKCKAFTSKTQDKEKIIDEFHQQKYEFLISTTILERGITIKGIYIIILQADHIVFNEASLVQIIGRVGRNIEMPTGEGYFLCTRKTKDITACIQTLENMNRGVI